VVIFGRFWERWKQLRLKVGVLKLDSMNYCCRVLFLGYECEKGPSGYEEKEKGTISKEQKGRHKFNKIIKYIHKNIKYIKI
jgi:hypothetical protein